MRRVRVRHCSSTTFPIQSGRFQGVRLAWLYFPPPIVFTDKIASPAVEPEYAVDGPRSISDVVMLFLSAILFFARRLLNLQLKIILIHEISVNNEELH